MSKDYLTTRDLLWRRHELAVRQDAVDWVSDTIGGSAAGS
jgi:hypothetical protein